MELVKIVLQIIKTILKSLNKRYIMNYEAMIKSWEYFELKYNYTDYPGNHNSLLKTELVFNFSNFCSGIHKFKISLN